MKNQLFYTAHQLVEAGPKQAVSWFAVGCYYHLLDKNELAQRYFLKVGVRTFSRWVYVHSQGGVLLPRGGVRSRCAICVNSHRTLSHAEVLVVCSRQRCHAPLPWPDQPGTELVVLCICFQQSLLVAAAPRWWWFAHCCGRGGVQRGGRSAPAAAFRIQSQSNPTIYRSQLTVNS